MMNLVDQYHFILMLSAPGETKGRRIEVETRLAVFSQRTLDTVYDIVERKMYGHISARHFYLVPVKTGTGGHPLTHIRIPLYIKHNSSILKRNVWLQRKYTAIQVNLSHELAEHEDWLEVPPEWLELHFGSTPSA